MYRMNYFIAAVVLNLFKPSGSAALSEKREEEEVEGEGGRNSGEGEEEDGGVRVKEEEGLGDGTMISTSSGAASEGFVKPKLPPVR